MAATSNDAASKGTRAAGDEEDDWEYYDDSIYLTDFWQGLLDSAPQPPDDEKLPSPLESWLEAFARAAAKAEAATETRIVSADHNLFKDYWRVVVPILLAPKHNANALEPGRPSHEQRVRQKLIEPLVQFICGSTDVDAVVAQLTADDVPPALCGKVFNAGDPCYSCRDCGQDATCVMCHPCFQASQHKEHRYKMSTSDGGGYCDCGDEEAFRSGAFCADHAAAQRRRSSKSAANKSGGGDSLAAFPPDVRQRTRTLLYHVCKYALELGSSMKKHHTGLAVGEKEKETWPQLRYPFHFSNNCLLLHNDDSHSYQEVIKTVKRALGASCSQKMASDITTFVDKEGRAILKTGDYSDCATLRDKVEALSKRDGTSLKVTIVPAYIIAHQVFAIRLLKWLAEELLPKASGFRTLFAEVVFLSDGELKIDLSSVRHTEKPSAADSSADDPALQRHPICEAILLNDAYVWKEKRKAWMALLIEGVMKDYEAKKKLAKSYVANYGAIMDDFVWDDQEADDATVTNLTVQIFTVPSMAQALIAEGDAFAIVIGSFLKHLQHIQDEDGRLELDQWLEDEKSEYSRAASSLADLCYLLSVPPDEGSVSETLRKSFVAGVRGLVKLLGLLQGLDKQKRQTGTHIEYDNMEWEYVFKITIEVEKVTTLVHEWCAKDKGLLVGALNEVFASPSTAELFRDVATTDITLDFMGVSETFSVPEVNVAVDLVSVHSPIQRFIAGLVPSFGRYPELHRHLRARLEAAGPMLHLINPTLTSLVVFAQVNTGMWRRNGIAAEGPNFYYHHPRLCPGLKRHDLMLLQAALANAGESVDAVVVALLHRFRLVTWANGELEKAPETRLPEFYERMHGLADEFLSLLLATQMERFTAPNVGLPSDAAADGAAKGSNAGTGSNVSKASNAASKTSSDVTANNMEYRVIQLLSAGEYAHSQIVKVLAAVEKDETALDGALKRVAELVQSKKEVGKKEYRLKKEFVGRYNPFCYFATREQLSLAMERQIKAPLKCCPPPVLPEWAPVFAGLPKVLSSRPLLQLISTTLNRAAEDKNPLLASKHLHKVLFLVLLGYREDVRAARRQPLQTTTDTFAKSAEKFKLHELLTAIKSPQDDVADLLSFTVAEVSEARKSLLHLPQATTTADVSKVSSAAASASVSPSAADEDDDAARRKQKSEAAAARRAKIMAQMAQAQKSFAKKHVDDLSDVSGGVDEPMDVTQGDSIDIDAVAVGRGKGRPNIAEQTITCILCQEESRLGAASKAIFMMAAYIQRSTVLSREANATAFNLGLCDDQFLPLTLRCGPHVSSCGHTMHAACYQKYFDSLISKERQRNAGLLARQIMNYDVEKQEYLCPICERLSNAALPIVPHVGAFYHCDADEADNKTFHEWVQSIDVILGTKYVEEDETTSSSDVTASSLPYLRVRPEQAPGTSKKPKYEPSSKMSDHQSLPDDLNDTAKVFCLTTVKIACKSKDEYLELLSTGATFSSYYRVLQMAVQSSAMAVHCAFNGTNSAATSWDVFLSSRESNILRSVVRLSLILPIIRNDGVAAESVSGAAAITAAKHLHLHKYLRSNAIYLLSALLGPSHDSKERGLMGLDALGSLLMLVVALPSLTFPETSPRVFPGYEDHHVVLLCYLQHLLQLLVTCANEFSVAAAGAATQEEMSIKRLLMEIATHGGGVGGGGGGRAGASRSGSQAASAPPPQLRGRPPTSSQRARPNAPPPPPPSLSDLLRRRLMPFLRSAAITLHLVTDVPLPPSSIDSFDALTAYLGLPAAFAHLVKVPGVGEVIDRLLRGENSLQLTAASASASTETNVLPVRPIRLVELPDDYASLLNRAAQFRCPNNVTGECRLPTLCLVCGDVICSQSHCCEVEMDQDGKKCGGCTVHARRCGADKGIFLRLRDCRILLLADVSRGALLPAPYIDEYGEADPGLRRGNPLKLDTSAIEELNKMWVNNDIPDKISRTFDQDVFIMQADWHTF